MNNNKTHKVESKSLAFPPVSTSPNPTSFSRNTIDIYPPTSLSMHMQTHHLYIYIYVNWRCAYTFTVFLFYSKIYSHTMGISQEAIKNGPHMEICYF